MQEVPPERVATLFSALANPQRIQILLKLLEDPKCHTDLAGCVPIDVSTVWRHVKRLETAGLVETRREGRRVMVYPLHPQRLSRLLRLAAEICSSVALTDSAP